ncbi:MAG: AsnC family transcriptional regulator, partial [Thauera sp.]|nr:AsnC family transcriptional regulator [Thauera sp.]
MPRQLVLPEALDATDFRLLNEWQRDFPLVSRPFVHIADEVGGSEQAVLAAYRQMMEQGLVSRVGAVFAPRRLGASALAALAAPPERLEEVAARVSRDPSINHNYQREHRYNLWFVVTAASRAHLDEVVSGIERDTGCPVIVLPLEEEFHIDLGFDLKVGAQGRRAHGATSSGEPIALANGDEGCKLPAVERQLITALQGGLVLEPRPFERLAATVGLDETAVIARIEGWLG